MYQGLRNVSFSESFAYVLNERSFITKRDKHHGMSNGQKNLRQSTNLRDVQCFYNVFSTQRNIDQVIACRHFCCILCLNNETTNINHC